MAINRQTDKSTDDQITLDINNGDLKALKRIKDSLGLADEEAVLRFALAVLSQAKTDTVYIDDGTGAKIGLQPADSLKGNATNDTKSTDK